MYTGKLTQLDDFKPTALERLVAENAHFQALREARWPVKWGERLFGLQRKAGHDAHQLTDMEVAAYFEPTGKSPLSPNAAANLYDELSSHERAMMILMAKVARDAQPDSPEDQILIRDLCCWLDQLPGQENRAFRWDRHDLTMRTSRQRVEWLSRANSYRVGESTVWLLQRYRLIEEEMESVRSRLSEFFVRDPFNNDAPETLKLLEAQQPNLKCLHCSKSSSHYCIGGCSSINAVALVGSVKRQEIRRLFDRSIQKSWRESLFRVPRKTFRIPKLESLDTVLPQFIAISMEWLTPSQQQRVYELVVEWQARQIDENRQWYQDHPLQVIKPCSSRHLNALLIAHDEVDYHTWAVSERGASLWRQLSGYNLTVSIVWPRAIASEAA